MKVRDKFSDAWVLRPDDYVAVILKGNTTPADSHRIADQLRTAWPGVNLVVLANGIDLKVLRADK
jgi:hypothetical protein